LVPAARMVVNLRPRLWLGNRSTSPSCVRSV
jgi:hypothetical protein